MTLWPLTFEIIITFFISSLLLYRYGNWSEQNIVIIFSVFISWFFSFIVIFILPLDITSTAYRQCVFHANLTIHESTTTLPPPLTSSLSPLNVSTITSAVSTAAVNLLSISSTTSTEPDVNNASFTSEPSNLTTSSTTTPIPDSEIISKLCGEPWSYANPDVLRTLWSLVYWTIQILTWFVLPIMQTYSMNGEFTKLKKLKSSFIDNAIYYAGLGITLFPGLAYVAIKASLDWTAIKATCITASNTFGLVLLVILLGYGLVEIPRSCYYASKLTRTLNYLYFRVAKITAEKCEADGKLEDVIDQITLAYPASLSSTPFKRYMAEILKKCPSTLTDKLVNAYTTEGFTEGRPASTYTEKSFVRMNQSIKRASQTHHRVYVQWNNAIRAAIDMEDVIRNQMSHTTSFEPTFRPNFKFGYWATIKEALYSPRMEWYWKCKIRGPFYQYLSFKLAAASCIVIISELFLPIHNTPVNLFAYFFNIAKQNDSYLLIELISICSISYLCICVYFTIFKIRVFNYYYLAPDHQTDESSLIFSGMFLCRLTPALCLNFLRLINLDYSHRTEPYALIEQASFTQIMGHMDVLSFIRDGFDIYLPLVMVAFCVGTYFRFVSKILHFFGIEQFCIDDEVTQELIREGRSLVQREKDRRLRFSERVSRQPREMRESMPPTMPLESPGSSQNLRLSPSEEGRVDYTVPAASAMQDYKSFTSTSQVPVPKNIFDDV